jgi:hypothetical protein
VSQNAENLTLIIKRGHKNLKNGRGVLKPITINLLFIWNLLWRTIPGPW